MKFKAGDKVVVLLGEGTEILKEGKVYTVRHIQSDELAHGGQGLALEEIKCGMHSSKRFSKFFYFEDL